jgi:hypothetical protein
MARANQERSPEPREDVRPEEDEHAVPPPADELVDERPDTEPDSKSVFLDLGPEAELLTHYPDRTDWEASVSERARQDIHEGNRPKRR